MSGMLLRALKKAVVSKAQIKKNGANKNGSTQSIAANTWTQITGLVANATAGAVVENNGLRIAAPGNIDVTVNLVFSVTTSNTKQFRLKVDGVVVYTMTAASVGNLARSANGITVPAGLLTLELFTNTARVLSANTTNLLTVTSSALYATITDNTQRPSVSNAWTKLITLRSLLGGAKVTPAGDGIEIETDGLFKLECVYNYNGISNHQARIEVDGVVVVTNSAVFGTTAVVTLNSMTMKAGQVVSSSYTSAEVGNGVVSSASLTTTPLY